MTVFYADDDVDDIKMFNDIINLINPKIMCRYATDGVALLNLLRDSFELPDCIFLDLNMPRLGGRECLLKIKQERRFANIPIFIYSTSPPTDLAEFKELGATDYIVKPNSYPEIIEVLRQVLDNQYSVGKMA